jgi:hypothetical protein
VPIPQHPLGSFVLDLKASHAAKNTNWVKLRSGDTPKHIDLGLGSGDTQKLSLEMCRLVEEMFNGPVRFNGPPPRENRRPTWAPTLAIVAALAAQHLAEANVHSPKAPDGFGLQPDGTLEPERNFPKYVEVSSDTLEQIAVIVKGTGILKRFFNGRPLHCIFTEGQLNLSQVDRPRMTPTYGEAVRRVVRPDPTERLQVQVCRAQYADYVICSRR